MNRKSFKDNIHGADKLFSANNAIINTTEITIENKLDNILDIATDNISDCLRNDTYAAVTKAAKAKKISDSNLVEGILRQVLLAGK